MSVNRSKRCISKEIPLLRKMIIVFGNRLNGSATEFGYGIGTNAPLKRIDNIGMAEGVGSDLRYAQTLRQPRQVDSYRIPSPRRSKSVSEQSTLWVTGHQAFDKRFKAGRHVDNAAHPGFLFVFPFRKRKRSFGQVGIGSGHFAYFAERPCSRLFEGVQEIREVAAYILADFLAFLGG